MQEEEEEQEEEEQVQEEEGQLWCTNAWFCCVHRSAWVYGWLWLWFPRRKNGGTAASIACATCGA